MSKCRVCGKEIDSEGTTIAVRDGSAKIDLNFCADCFPNNLLNFITKARVSRRRTFYDVIKEYKEKTWRKKIDIEQMEGFEDG